VDVREVIEDMKELALKASLPAVPEVLEALEQVEFGTYVEDSLRAMARAREAVEELDRVAVRVARLHGLSWEEIGEELGLTRQGARYRYGRNDLAELDQLDELHDAERQALMSEIKLAMARDKAEGRDRAGDAMQQTTERLMALISEQVNRRSQLVRELRTRDGAR
jgi:hypothetical protein